MISEFLGPVGPLIYGFEYNFENLSKNLETLSGNNDFFTFPIFGNSEIVETWNLRHDGILFLEIVKI